MDKYPTHVPSIIIDDTRFNMFDLGYRYCPICNFYTYSVLKKSECRAINPRTGHVKISYGKNTHCECYSAKFRTRGTVETKRSGRNRDKILRKREIDPEGWLTMTCSQMDNYASLVIS